jgi:hypothetical protein
MILYGILYEDYQGEAGKGVDDELFTTVDAATDIARHKANEQVNELNTCVDDPDFGPYRFEQTNQGNGLPTFNIFGSHKSELEGFSVVAFTVDGVVLLPAPRKVT